MSYLERGTSGAGLFIGYDERQMLKQGWKGFILAAHIRMDAHWVSLAGRWAEPQRNGQLGSK
jgi:hypothetical protein